VSVNYSNFGVAAASNWLRGGRPKISSIVRKTAIAFDLLRNSRPFQTFNSLVHTGLSQKDTDAVLDLLDSGPPFTT
jgi:hypothetical protein